MGMRSSKHKSKSYDMAPVVSNKDFSYKKTTKTLPNVQLPTSQSVIVEETKSNGNIETNIQNELQDPRIPEWVNEINFKKLLLKTHTNITEITNFKAYPALAAGENYATLMLRVKMTAKFNDESTKDFSFMLKMAHDTKEMKDMLQTLNFFTIENMVYTDVIPELEDMYRKAGVEISFGPKFHRLDLEDENIHYVLLEDLGVRGFKNVNRLECLNMEHTLSVLRKMAQFHAATACRVAKNGAYSEVFCPDMDNEMVRVMMKQMFGSFKKPFLNNLKTYKDGEKYYDLMENFFDNLVELFIRGRKITPNFFNVLNHGDAWSNNILFQYAEDGKLKETLFVDFQNCNWSSPALDLYYFIISSVQIDIKLTHFDYFIHYYHEHLNKHLKILQYPLEIPNLREFHIQMLSFGAMATMTSFFTLAVVLLDSTENAKFENFLGDTEECNNFKNAMYSSERYRKYINEILPWLYNRGFMEINLIDIDKMIEASDKLKEPVTNVAVQTTKQEENIDKSSHCYPEWVNQSLFIDVVRADCENYQKVLKFAVSPATSVGDNYSSIMLKVDIDIELTDHATRNLSYVLKTPPLGDHAQEFVKMSKSFEKEIMTYSEIVPEFEKMFKEKAGTDVVFAPKYYKLTQDVGCKILVLENLKNKGFKTCDRLEGLDMKHTEAVLKKLAEFHAASACWFETKGKFPEVYELSLYIEENRERNEKVAETYSKIYLDCAKQYKGNEEYIHHVEDYLKNCTTNLINANKIDWSKFNVLNRGDCWINNIMFQHDNSGNIINTYFVDFQLAKYGTPCFDLYFFLLSSPKLELKLELFDYFICFYHQHLKTNLELLKYPKQIPSLKELHMEMLDNWVFSTYTVLSVLTVILLEPTDNTNMENMVSDDDTGFTLKKKMFSNERYRSHVEAIFPWLNNRGILNLK